MILLLCVISLMARGQNANTSGSVQCDTLKKTEQRQKCQRTPINDYSGLNSLRARLANRFWDGQSDTTKFHDAVDNETVQVVGQAKVSDNVLPEAQRRGGEGSTGNRYFDEVVSSGIPIGVPLLVFFKGGGTVLTDSAQLINVKAVAELAKEYRFRIRVTGSADSATGIVEKNEAVAKSRAKYIADYLISHDVS
ncbi:MAG: OmpA family protein, partial [Candidatus Methanomethylophilaceae archaeon]|nr:OmpA family protein [Candidatus Methanomethylophilaceae archaeon]